MVLTESHKLLLYSLRHKILQPTIWSDLIMCYKHRPASDVWLGHKIDVGLLVGQETNASFVRMKHRLAIGPIKVVISLAVIYWVRHCELEC
jgi:hypothetical protein